MKKLLLIIGTLLPFLSFSQDGLLDQTFGTNGIALAEGNYAAKGVSIQTDGKIVTAGSKSDANGTDFCIVRLNSDGKLDNTFGTDGVVVVDFSTKTDNALDMAIQADGKMIVVGSAIISNHTDIALIRLNTNGSLDNTFGTNGKVTTNIQGTSNDVASKVVIQADGKIVIIGSGGTDMFNANVVARYNTDGSLDNTFDTDGKLLGVSFAPVSLNTLSDIKILADGKFIISGYSSNQPAIGKLNADGSFDVAFNTTGKLVISETIFGGNVCLVAVQADGKVLMSYGSGTTSELKLLRLQTDGSLDTDFGTAGKASINIGANNDYAMAIKTLSNGKIIVSGSTYVNSSATDFFIARLNSNGSLDNTFGTNGFATTSVTTADGDRAEAMAVQSNGKIIVAGNKCTGSCNYVVLRYNNTSGGGTNTPSINEAVKASIFPNPANLETTIKLSEQAHEMKVIITDKLGKEMIRRESVNTSEMNITLGELTKGIYMVQVIADGVVSTQKLLIH
ncbi:MAG: T9SS type A sorting domain-containing protein [Bacteroidota bacterium]